MKPCDIGKATEIVNVNNASCSWGSVPIEPRNFKREDVNIEPYWVVSREPKQQITHNVHEQHPKFYIASYDDQLVRWWNSKDWHNHGGGSYVEDSFTIG